MKSVLRILTIGLLLVPGVAIAQEVLSGYDGYWAGQREITVLDLVPFYPDGMGRLRNEIFARYGRSFRTPAYQDYFNTKPWYRIVTGYRESWPTERDMENAQLILSVERSTLSAEATVEQVLEVIEYTSGRATLTFTSRDTVIWSDPRVDFGMYGLDGYDLTQLQWIPFGNWVLVYEPGNREYSVVAYRIDHESASISDPVWEEIDRSVFEALMNRIE